MKKSILFIFFIGFVGIALGQNPYEKGFKKGYEKGYCQNQGFGCVSPISPVAPIPKAGESNDSYNDGYNRGFEKGLNDSKLSKTEVDNNDNIYEGSTNGYPNSPSNNGAIRKPIKYSKPQSRINHNLIADILRKKQEAIDRERAYINSLSYEDRKAILEKRAYSRRKSNLYKKNLSRFNKANKKQKKITKNLNKELERNEKTYLKSKGLLKISDIKNGWHETIVNIWVNNKANYVKRLIHFKNGVITKYVGGTGFKAYIKSQKNNTPEVITLSVGYEDSQNQKIYVSFIKNTPIKLKEEPVFPTIIKFYTTVSDEGKFFIFLKGKDYSDYFTLHQSFNIGANINCEQSKGVVTFYVKPYGNYNFYAHSDASEWSGNINTSNRYCIIKELSN